MSFLRKPRAGRALGALFVAASLALAGGCGSDDKKRPATQVAAKVNADEITVHQVNGALANAGNVAPESAEAVKRQVLERLVDQRLAVQQAIHKKLDRSPAVQQALEASRAEILARAYLNQVASSKAKPTAEDVRKYYVENPALFAQRRLFSLEEIALEGGDANVASELSSRIAKGRPQKETTDWLEARGVKFAFSRGVRAAEQLPLEILPRLHAAKDGELVVVGAGSSHRVIRIVASKSEPVDEATAAARIEQFLFNRRAADAIAQDMKQLRAGAEIQYVGEFAASATEADAGAKARAAAQAEALAKAKAEAEAQTRAEQATKARQAAETKARLETEAKARAASSEPLPQENIKKGLGGLK